MLLTPTWRNTLNSGHAYHGDLNSYLQVVRKSGYPFYEWNGRIFRTDDNSEVPDAAFWLSVEVTA